MCIVYHSKVANISNVQQSSHFLSFVRIYINSQKFKNINNRNVNIQLFCAYELKKRFPLNHLFILSVGNTKNHLHLGGIINIVISCNVCCIFNYLIPHKCFFLFNYKGKINFSIAFVRQCLNIYQYKHHHMLESLILISLVTNQISTFTIEL